MDRPSAALTFVAGGLEPVGLGAGLAARSSCSIASMKPFTGSSTLTSGGDFFRSGGTGWANVFA